MDGDGPSAGRPKQMGLILASPNPHAIDAAALDIVGERPENVPTVRIAVERLLLAPAGDDRYHTVGDLTTKASVDGFRMPPKTRVLGGIPSVLGAFVSEGVSRKPVFLGAECIGCGACEEICPGEALTVDRTAKDVAIDRGMCIRCYCCQEVCPQKAVALRRMPLRSWGRALAGRLKGHSTD
jgi:ferredoxin